MIARFFGGLALLLGLLLPLGCAAPEWSVPGETTERSATVGALLVVGGGKIPDAVRSRFIELAGGPEALLLIFPQASTRENAGAGHEKAWRDGGARNIAIADLSDRAQLLRDLDAARAIWFGGGSQNRLMAALRDAGVLDEIRHRHRAGCVVGGTSAGAAVMSASMITGEAHTDRLATGTTELAEGLGFWPGVIVDQHFLRRERFMRLFSATLDHPEAIGVGIDEGTAVIVEGESWRVIGAGHVIVIDARAARVTAKETKVRAEDVRVHALPPGSEWSPRAPLRK